MRIEWLLCFVDRGDWDYWVDFCVVLKPVDPSYQTHAGIITLQF